MLQPNGLSGKRAKRKREKQSNHVLFTCSLPASKGTPREREVFPRREKRSLFSLIFLHLHSFILAEKEPYSISLEARETDRRKKERERRRKQNKKKTKSAGFISLSL